MSILFGSLVSATTTAKIFFELTPSDVTEYTPEMGLKALYVSEDGDLALTDHDDNQITIAVIAGQMIYMSPKLVNAATDATVVGLFG